MARSVSRKDGRTRACCALLSTLTVLGCAARDHDAAHCVDQPLPLQDPGGHTLGETFYLPGSTGAPGCPPRPAWSIDAAPRGSVNTLYPTGAPLPRFTPDVAGTYRFSVHGGDASVALTVVARPPAERFRNHYLTPLYGATRVGDEVWTANGATYTVTRVGVDDGSVIGEIHVGSWPAAVAWREPLPYVLVAQRGSDTIGFVNRARGALEDALWVGDEPTGLAIDPHADLLYVSLPTADQIAVVDLEQRTVVDRIGVGFDPRALVISPDGRHLVAASYRSRNREADVRGVYDGAPDEDLFIIDLPSRAVTQVARGVTATQRALAFDTESRLYVAGTDGNPIPPQTAEEDLPFEHEIVRIDDLHSANAPRARVDLTRQPTSTGPVVNPSGVLVRDGVVWVSSESSNLVLLLNGSTLEEIARVEVGAGARQLVDLGALGVAVHCYADRELWFLGARGDVRRVVTLHDDARPAPIADGERIYLRPGAGNRANHTCTSCHVEAQNEGMLWWFAPNEWANVRPNQLLAATKPLGWSGYTSSAANFGFQGPGSILGRPPTVDEANALGAFLGSLIGAPRANAHTNLDGSYTAAALRGREIFEGKATCSTCHQPPLYTSRALIAKGKSGIEADVPTLLGVYRHGLYFINGQARRLEAALDVALAYVAVDLDVRERADLLSFLRQLTPKGSAPLGTFPDNLSGEAVEPDVAPWVAFADPPAVDPTPFVTLQTLDGPPVDATVTATGGRLQLTPRAPLPPGTYLFRVRAGLPFTTGGTLVADRVSRFDVVATDVTWPREPMRMVVTAGGPRGPVKLGFTIVRAADGPARETRLELTADPPVMLRQTLWTQADGREVKIQPFALPVGSAFGDGREVIGTVTATRADGSIARIEGTLTLSAPGRETPDLPFTIR